MSKGDIAGKTRVQRYFAGREMQVTIALLTVVALLAGIFLQTISSLLTAHYGFSVFFLGFFLIIGYCAIVLLIAVFFTHRFLGPFKRIEHEMRLISGGELSRRLSIRTKDDLHVRNFVNYTNAFIASFEKLSKDYNALNSVVSLKLGEASSELSKEKFDCQKLKTELLSLQKQIHAFKEKK